MPARVTSARFVGREREFGRVAGAFERAAAGSANTVLLTAPGGSGTTRFLDEVVGRVATADRPVHVLRGRAAGPVDPPWQAVRQALLPALMALGPAELGQTVGPAGGDVARLFPELARRLSKAHIDGDVPVATSPEREQPRLLEGLLGVLGRLGERRPVLLVLENLHMADAATRAFLTFVARIARDERLLLVGTYQPDRVTSEHPLHATLARIEGAPRPPQIIGFPPLDRREMAALVEAIEGERPSASVVVLVAERSGGNPVVAEELLAARRELHGASLSGTLEDLVIARLALRTTECRRVLRLLAPAERPLSRERLAQVAAAYEYGADRPPPRSSTRPRRGDGALDADVAAGVADALEHGFLVERDGLVMIRHESTARAVVRDVLPHQRAHYHRALATAWADEPVIAAAHWLAAHEPVRAAAAAIDAAGRAEAVAAPADALEALELALELAGGPGASDPGLRSRIPELQRRAAEAAYAGLRATRAVAFAEAALGGLDEGRDRAGLGLLHERLGQYRLAAGDDDGALAALRRAVELVPREAPRDRARVLASLAQLLMIVGSFREAERLAREAIEAAEVAGSDAAPEAIHARTTLGVVLGWGDRPGDAVELLERARGDAGALGRIEDRMRATANLTTVLDLLGRRDEAVEVAYAGIEEARRAGLAAVYGNVLGGNVADTLFALGRWDEARRLSLRALEWSPTGVSFVNAIVNLVIVEIESTAGEEAGRLLGRILLELETGRDVQYAVPAYQATASLALWSGDLVDAARAAERGWRRVRETEDWVLIARMAATALEVDAAVVAAALERRRIAEVAAARQRSASILAAAVRAVDGSGVAPTLGSRREAEAHLATARAFRARLEGRDDPTEWDGVARAWSALGERYRVARARWRQTEAVLAAAGAGSIAEQTRTDARVVRADARGPLREAAAIALELGARPLLREVRELARRALIALPPEVDELLEAPPPEARLDDATLGDGVERVVGIGTAGEVAAAAAAHAPANGDAFGLSHREREVLSLIAQGRTNREIGDRLFISQKTVGVHVGNILAKLGVSGRVEAAAVAIRLGMTERRGPGARR